ncbi:predicted protein [Uncinocarpus reesii 1704]|uniref:Uncharacterized protein n=1 Tax=Uncinocarpus reesii (strain UAMH 1704) TaxID=336963 RepID=C4JEU0_UNCRE|nr:uncharacterized protein UREG_02250 [Uncinocarpus reesii 1704]EEP77401.1 predicted protein [Uncinocarpus reesii 1704]
MPSSPTKPTLAPLDTSKALVFPSEFHDSPLFSAKFEMLKHEDALKTPITPPVAYTDLLKTLTPMVATPLSSSTLSTDKSSNPSTGTSPYFCNCEQHPRSLTIPLKTPGSAATTKSQPERSQRTPRTPLNLRPLRISASAKGSPITESPRSASLRSILSPAGEWPVDAKVRYLDASRCSSCARPVTVRQVVTRTITYKRTPLDPAPRGKRRKMEEKK